MSVEVTTRVSVQEVDGKETGIPPPSLTVSNHWNRTSMVVLEFGEIKVTVHAGELRRAIKNTEG